MKKCCVLSLVLVLASVALAVPVYVDVSFDNPDYGVSAGSVWAVYMAQSGYEVPSDIPFYVENGVTNAVGLPVNSSTGTMLGAVLLFTGSPTALVTPFST